MKRLVALLAFVTIATASAQSGEFIQNIIHYAEVDKGPCLSEYQWHLDRTPRAVKVVCGVDRRGNFLQNAIYHMFDMDGVVGSESLTEIGNGSYALGVEFEDGNVFALLSNDSDFMIIQAR